MREHVRLPGLVFVSPKVGVGDGLAGCVLHNSAGQRFVERHRVDLGIHQCPSEPYLIVSSYGSSHC